MIRKMGMDDLDIVTKIDAACFPIPWNTDQYTYELKDNAYAFLFVLETEEGIVGFIDFWITFDICQLAKIAVLPQYRNRHFAHELMEMMIAFTERKGCENISLEVRTSNTAAHHLYAAFDFIKVNVRKNYYNDNGEDADVLIKALGGAL